MCQKTKPTGKKIRESEKEWIPYALVIGDKEMAGGSITVRPRLGKQFATTVKEFIKRLQAEVAGKPQLPAIPHCFYPNARSSWGKGL